MSESFITENISKVMGRIRSASQKWDRAPDSVTLLAVSKTRTATELQQAWSAGLRAFGENYLQEALDKQQLLQKLPICWHFIGPIQSNKTRAIAEHFDWVHGVDRLKIARRLNDARPETRDPLNICIQVNISAEATKSGVAPQQVAALAAEIEHLPRLRLRGLMAIPAATDNVQEQTDAFARMSTLLRELQCSHSDLDTLSMGMSADLEIAIAQGSTLVRVGTDIFGPRPT